MDKYKDLTMQEKENIKLMIYKEFEKKFSKKYKNLNPQELEYERNKYVSQNFSEALEKFKKNDNLDRKI